MACTEIMSSYIKKLSHPLKEIRERSLQLLVAKLRLGWELEDELGGTRELLEALLAWFEVQHPTLQREALQLLLSTIKTKAGTYIAREIGVKKIISTLSKVKSKIDAGAMEIYYDVLETLRFLNTVESEENVAVPPLTLHSLANSDSEDRSTNSGYYNVGYTSQSSKTTSVSNEEPESNINYLLQPTEGVRVLLYPWVELCSSDSKTILLVEDALKLLKSTRRCCRFICDVFLQDFPADIFLNRPCIIQSLVTIADGTQHSGQPGDALFVLLSITQALRTRLRQLSSLDLIHDANKLSFEHKDSIDSVNIELEQMAGDRADLPSDNEVLAALKQLPAPIYALDTLNTVLSILGRSIALVDPVDKSEVLDLRESNLCLSLVECLVQLLLDCVGEDFWYTEHNSKTLRDIAHKSCMVMRLLGDLLAKYKKSFSEDPSRSHHRMLWFRLVSCAERLLWWARHSALPPSGVAVALQLALLDPAVELLYPELCKKVSAVLKNTNVVINQDYKSKYRELKKLFACMEDAAQFMKNKNGRSSKNVLQRIKTSLPVLELHLSEAYLDEISDIILNGNKYFELDDNDWNLTRSLALTLMAHSIEWVQVKFYRKVADMVRAVLVGDEANQVDIEKSLTLLCDVGVLTEICCHGLSSKLKEVESCASDIMLYLLRGRLVLSEACWWRLLASLLPVLPLLHVYANDDTQLGQAICKSLESDIAECLGVPQTEVRSGLVRLLFVRCPPVQMDAARTLCRLLDDEKYLPPREALRVDVLISALIAVEPQEFNVDYNHSPSKVTSTTGLIQILDVLKQDIVFEDENTTATQRPYKSPALEPSLRRSTLQQLSVILRQQESHDAFLQSDGLKVIVATLRMSLKVDDYLAFPECALSCVSVLNSVCFTSRHTLGKIPDLPLLLLRVILVFPANESAVLMSSQILALVAWSGFALQELDATRHRVPALPLSVTEHTTLPFVANSYWNTSPNAEHSSIEWLLSDEDIRAAIRVRWWCACESPARVIRGAPPPPVPLALRPTARDLAALRAACPLYCCTKALLDLENATSHKQVEEALNMLQSATHLLPLSSVHSADVGALPWHHTRRFLCAPPASSRDTALLISLLRFILAYMDNVPRDVDAMTWIKKLFISNDATVISLLSRDEFYIEQTSQESIEITQLHIHIVKVLLRCIKLLEDNNDYDSNKMESLVKILLACLQRVDLKNFHMLGYLNELVRCIRYALNSRYCKLSEDMLAQCLKTMAATLAGCAAGGGRKGQACRLDATLSLLALLAQIHNERVPVQRWSEAWNHEVVCAVVKCTSGARAELRAAALHAMAALAHHAQLMPQLLQAISMDSLSQFAASIFAKEREANVVRCAAAALLTSLAARVSSHVDVTEHEILEQLKRNDFVESCVDILVDFCNEKTYGNNLEPNIPCSVLERRTELEVRAQKCGDVHISPSLVAVSGRPPPTPALVAAVADVLYNVNAFASCPVQSWNDRGVYRLLFRCASWSKGDVTDATRVRLASCRALTMATTHKCVRVALATTKDCLLSLLATLTPFDEEEIAADRIAARTQSLLLLSALLTERAASDTLWRTMRDANCSALLHTLLQALHSDDTDLRDAALYCLTQFAQSAIQKKQPDKSRDDIRIGYFDNIKSPYERERGSAKQGAGDRDDCEPDFMSEELCKILVHLYKKLSTDAKIFGNQDESWHRACSCLSSVLAISPRSRQYGVHRQFPRMLLATLQAVRDRLALHGSVDSLRSAVKNPTLATLYWLLILIDCHMVDCVPAKDTFAEDGIALSLNRLWPWCMLTPELREAILHLLFTFTNDSAKAWSAMSSCVGGRSLAGEVCAVTSREAALQSKPRSDASLLLCLRTVTHLLPHQHCRAIIIKSDVVSCMYKLRVRERGMTNAGAEWARLCEALARYPDGAGAILALRPLLAAPPVRARLMPAIAHVARHRRSAVLQAPDLLELLSGTLLAGDTAEMVSAARAVWALAANNHKAKLLLRSAGIASAVQSALQRIQRLPNDGASQRAMQLLMYTNSILHNT